MSENLSIDEIIKKAETIRKKAEKQAKSAMNDIDKSAREITERTIQVPTVEPEDIVITPVKKPEESGTASLDKTAVVDVKSAETQTDHSKTQVVSQKTRTVSVSEKTAVVPEIKPTKKSFFKTQGAEPVYSKKPPEMVERPATIKSKSRFDKTSDLEEIPTIVAVDELEHTKLIFGKDNPRPVETAYDSDESDQIVLAGFEDTSGQVEKIDEEVAEQQLRERRREKVNKFRLFSPDEIEEEGDVPSSVAKNEYKNDEEKTEFLEKLFSSKSSVNFAATITLVAGIIVGALTKLQSSAHLPSFLLDETNFFIVLAVIFGITLVVNFKNLIHGFSLKHGINSDFPISILCTVVLVHTILLACDVNMVIDNGCAYTLVAIFALLMSNLGKRQMIIRIIKNFEFLVSQEETHTVETIANTVDATIISRGVLTGEANLKTSIKTDFTTKYLDISSSDEPADNIAKYTGCIMIGVSLLLFIVTAIITHSWYKGFNLGVCAMAISCPCISLYCTNNLLLRLSKALKPNGAMINGFEGASMVSEANAIVIEAQDLFGPRSCEIHGIKTFNGAKVDDVILKTAAVIMKTKSPLSSVFDDVIIGKQTILPEVDGVLYEDRLGTSAWIYRKKILVGTRELLIHHGVQVPKVEFEKKYMRKNRKVLYLAVAGKLMAMLVVSYNADPKLKRALKKLEKSGITILVKSADPFINDESIAELFALPQGYIRVMNTSNARAFEKYSNMCVERSPAYVVHNGSALSFVSAMAGAERLEDSRRVLSVLISFGCAMGLGVVALLGFINATAQLNAINVVVFQAVWCLFIQTVSRLKKTI